MLQIKTSYVISSACEEVEAAFLMKGTHMSWAQVRASTPSQPSPHEDCWLPTSLLHTAPHNFWNYTGNKGFSFFFLKATVLLCWAVYLYRMWLAQAAESSLCLAACTACCGVPWSWLQGCRHIAWSLGFFFWNQSCTAHGQHGASVTYTWHCYSNKLPQRKEHQMPRAGTPGMADLFWASIGFAIYKPTSSVWQLKHTNEQNQ